MIKLRENVVMTLLPDGSTTAMEVELLQTKLKRSWRAAGYPDDSIAEDVAISVELALSEFNHAESFTPAEIDSFVVKVLREAGLTEVAEHYGLDFNVVDSSVPFTRDEISTIIQKFMAINEIECDSLCARVLDAGKKIGITRVTPTLILELAKYFQVDSAKLADTPAQTANIRSKQLPTRTWLLTNDEIFAAATPATQTLLSSKALAIRGVSALFPAINIEFDIARFANESKLIPPVPEFALLPHLSEAIDGVNDLVGFVDAFMLKRDEGDSQPLAARLSIVNPDIFTETWLGARWPAARGCLVELMEELSNSFDREIYLHT